MIWIGIAVLCVPLFLTATACVRYVSASRALGRQLPMMVIGLLLVLVSSACWIFIFAIMTLQERSARVYAIARTVSPSPVGLANLLVCLGAIICARLTRNSPQTAAARRALTVAASVLMVIWLLLALNPH